MMPHSPLLTYSLGPGAEAFSTTRHGGCSEGAYASMNCTPYTGDAPEKVALNQKRLLQLLPHGSSLIIPYQTHGTQVLQVDHGFLQADTAARHQRLQGIDALMTQVPHQVLCISTADCIPLLLHDGRNRAIAAIHAGWRGTVGRIVEKTLKAMGQAYGTRGTDVKAVIGPGISVAAFEVGDEVYEAFREAAFPMERMAEWHNPTHKWHIDLPEACRWQLLQCGVPAEQITQSGICTYTQHELYFSARRLGIRSGRILSGITLTA